MVRSGGGDSSRYNSHQLLRARGGEPGYEDGGISLDVRGESRQYHFLEDNFIWLEFTKPQKP